MTSPSGLTTRYLSFSYQHIYSASRSLLGAFYFPECRCRYHRLRHCPQLVLAFLNSFSLTEPFQFSAFVPSQQLPFATDLFQSAPPVPIYLPFPNVVTELDYAVWNTNVPPGPKVLVDGVLPNLQARPQQLTRYGNARFPWSLGGLGGVMGEDTVHEAAVHI